MEEQPFDIVLRVLNEAYRADPDALHALICNRVPCNLELADHPSIQVTQNGVVGKNTYHVGLLGVINGIIEPITKRKVAVKFSAPEAGKTARVEGFVEYIKKD